MIRTEMLEVMRERNARKAASAAKKREMAKGKANAGQERSAIGGQRRPDGYVPHAL